MEPFKILLIAATILSLTACEKVIDLQLNTSSSQIVIQGTIYDHPGTCRVSISRTIAFDTTGVYPPVTGATVEIHDNSGTIQNLTESTPGTYTTYALHGTIGQTYTLIVNSGGKEYKAVSTMGNPPLIDSLSLIKSNFGNFNLVNVEFKDPLGLANYYRLIEFINNKKINGSHVTNNLLNQKDNISYSFYSSDENNPIASGDTITVWVETIDKGVYEYFRTTGNYRDQSVSPSNPVSNIDNGALGYFNACSVRSKTVIVK
jgi:hypothetical protein